MTDADRILEAVCAASGITRAQLLGDQRAPKYARPRQLAYFLMSTRTGLSLPAIGRKMGRDHTSVMWGLRRWPQISHEPDCLALERAVRAHLLALIVIPIQTKRNVSITTTAVNRQRWLRQGPTPGSLRLLDVMHRLGRNCTVAQLSERTGMNEYSVREHLPPLIWTGYIASERKANPYADGGSCAFLTPLKDSQGRPCTPQHDARPPSARPVALRKCNRCRRTFQPAHRFNFRCASCDHAIKNSPDYSAAPGMEFVA